MQSQSTVLIHFRVFRTTNAWLQLNCGKWHHWPPGLAYFKDSLANMLSLQSFDNCQPYQLIWGFSSQLLLLRLEELRDSPNQGLLTYSLTSPSHLLESKAICYGDLQQPVKNRGLSPITVLAQLDQVHYKVMYWLFFIPHVHRHVRNSPERNWQFTEQLLGPKSLGTTVSSELVGLI